MNRKPIRLTATSYALLALLDQLGEATSYDIKQALEKSIENFWPVPHTTAYEEPARLAEGGYLTVKQEDGGRRRKSYTLTEAGREALRAWADEPSAGPPQLRDEMLLKVFAGADPTSMLPARKEWHMAKLDELQGYLDEVREAEGWDASERVLIAGVGYHRVMLDLLESLEQAEIPARAAEPGRQ
jgi:PadR family transcriptional regulator, regulatory protein AphA